LVAALLVVLSVGFIGWRIYSAFDRRSSQLNALLTREQENKIKIARGAKAANTLQQFADSALPADSDVARSMYQDWLMKVVSDVGLQNAKVTAQPVRPFRDVYTMHPFRVIGDGNIQQLTDLLFAVYSTDALHRIQLLTIQPHREKRDMTITLVVEALSMPSAPDRKTLSSDPEAIVNGHDREHYRSKIVGRNLFGPENHPPKLSGESSLVAYRGQRFEFTAKAEDPDKGDSVKYEADLSQLPGARMSGDRLEWTPAENGDYQVTITARDNGFPSRDVKRDFKISVKDPPKAEGPKRSFDAAKHAYITGVTENNGEPEVWLTIRTEGRTLRLGIGEAFKVGEMEGKIAEVIGNRVVIDAGGEKITTRLGQPLVQ
jgi:hypothetical protein